MVRVEYTDLVPNSFDLQGFLGSSLPNIGLNTSTTSATTLVAPSAVPGGAIVLHGAFVDSGRASMRGPITAIELHGGGGPLVIITSVNIDISSVLANGLSIYGLLGRPLEFEGSNKDDIFTPINSPFLAPPLDDILRGGAGNDRLYGVDGDDQLYGGPGNDRLSAGEGDDLIDGGNGNDTLDFLDDFLRGSRIVDLAAGTARDGQGGNDTLVSIENVTTGDDNDQIFGDEHANRLEANGGDDLLIGRGGNDVLTGGEGADELFGGDGDDQLRDSSDGNLFDGGAGVDTVMMFGSPNSFYTVNLINGMGGRNGANDQIYLSIENLTGGNGDDIFFGNSGANHLNGSGGDDQMNGRGGDDLIQGAIGDDILVGGAGDDIVDGGIGDDVIGGRIGDDVLSGGDGDDRLFGQLGDDIIDGGTGNDQINGGVGDDLLAGGEGDDTMLGRNDDDLLEGGDGDDALNGGGGADRLVGGDGDDLLIGGADGDVFVFDASGFGNDQLFRYADGLDRFEISIDVAEDFSALSIEQIGADTVLSFGGGTVTLVARQAELIDTTDFDFI